MRFVLASASPARLSVLRAAGIEPVVRVSGVDERAVQESLSDPAPAELVTALATAKAEAVVERVAADFDEAVIVGCDSMLWVPGEEGDELVGKPATAELAARRWERMAGGSGELLTGHAVLRLSGGTVVDRVGDHLSTGVRFGEPSAHELDRYIATGEPLRVAGGFTLDGLGGWFVNGVDGDPSSVIGISLPLTRSLLARVGVEVVSLWNRAESVEQAPSRADSGSVV
ncbi:Maf family protein [Actinopolyspora mortivallis]|uniref:Nucleoside triphosphate pyrophosphatase n=1 Tax=Actinopolyspora mortivallis TaxID=33906 RepID=A0A2T0GTL0_ACTMO|nr:nucleoside triphosphate pyrophosphatase [Actinopolyspora mortivallis]PRW62437.1 septum formation inhibitor Maf [Actinopolyspora mortivallis]